MTNLCNQWIKVKSNEQKKFQINIFHIIDTSCGNGVEISNWTLLSCSFVRLHKSFTKWSMNRKKTRCILWIRKQKHSKILNTKANEANYNCDKWREPLIFTVWFIFICGEPSHSVNLHTRVSTERVLRDQTKKELSRHFKRHNNN